jgi:hypothetical protein
MIECQVGPSWLGGRLRDRSFCIHFIPLSWATCGKVATLSIEKTVWFPSPPISCADLHQSGRPGETSRSAARAFSRRLEESAASRLRQTQNSSGGKAEGVFPHLGEVCFPVWSLTKPPHPRTTFVVQGAPEWGNTMELFCNELCKKSQQRAEVQGQQSAFQCVEALAAMLIEADRLFGDRGQLFGQGLIVGLQESDSLQDASKRCFIIALGVDAS